MSKHNEQGLNCPVSIYHVSDLHLNLNTVYQKCGEIYVKDKIEFLLICAVCKLSFVSFEEFGIHSKVCCQNTNTRCLSSFNDYLKSDEPDNIKTRKENTNFNESYETVGSTIDNTKTSEEMLNENKKEKVVVEEISIICDEDNSEKNEIECVKKADQEFIDENDLHENKKPKRRKKNVYKPTCKIMCNRCKQRFENQEKLDRHIKDYHDVTEVKSLNVNYVCKDCNKNLKSQHKLDVHFTVCRYRTQNNITNSNDKDYLTKCGLKSNDDSIFAEPIQYMDPCICRYCGKRLNKNASRILHEKIHTGEKPFKCDLCGKRFRMRNQYKNHIKVHKGIKPYKCHLCDAAFSLSTNLRVHLQRHTGEKPYNCEYCDKKFVSTSEKRSHERQHTGERPYKCEKCNEYFPNCSGYNRHLFAKHASEYPRPTFDCKQCDRIFKRSRDLNEHFASKHSDKRYPCDLCMSTFTTQRNLIRHKFIHSDAKLYLCSICGKNYNQSAGLRRHMKTHKNKNGNNNHNIESEVFLNLSS